MNFSRALFLLVFFEGALCCLGIFNYGWTLDGMQAIARYSEMLSLIIFSIIFLYHQHPLITLGKIVSDKYFLLLAIAQGIHVIELLSFMRLAGTEPIPSRIIGGTLGCLLIFAMPLVQYRAEENKMTDRMYSQLTLFSTYAIWFVFFFTFLPRVRGTLPDIGGNYQTAVLLLGWVSVLLGVKMSQLFAKKRVRRK